MNKKIILMVLVVWLLVFVAVVAFAQNNQGVRWEYTSVNGTNLDKFNELGQQGWEIATVNGSSIYVFKRRLP